MMKEYILLTAAQAASLTATMRKMSGYKQTTYRVTPAPMFGRTTFLLPLSVLEDNMWLSRKRALAALPRVMVDPMTMSRPTAEDLKV